MSDGAGFASAARSNSTRHMLSGTAGRAVAAWMLVALGWAALFLLTVASGDAGMGAALWDGNVHHVVAALLGIAWGPILVATAAPRTKAASVGMSIALAVAFGAITLLLTEAFSPLALLALMPIRGLEVMAARSFRRTRDTVGVQAEAPARR
jgi:hypothetical protein